MPRPAIFLVLTLAVIGFLSLPYFVTAQNPLVPCDNCTLDDLFKTDPGAIMGEGDGLIARVIDFALFYLVVPLATISIAVAGFRMIVGGDKPGERDKAKEIMLSVVIGIVVAFGAWLIINTVLKFLVAGNDGNFNPPIESNDF